MTVPDPAGKTAEKSPTELSSSEGKVGKVVDAPVAEPVEEFVAKPAAKAVEKKPK
jgi:hypothetical protein